MTPESVHAYVVFGEWPIEYTGRWPRQYKNTLHCVDVHCACNNSECNARTGHRHNTSHPVLIVDVPKWYTQLWTGIDYLAGARPMNTRHELLAALN
jgi:hypothetical protein